MPELKMLRDDLITKDKIANSNHSNKSAFRTQIIGGYDAYKDKRGVTQFGEVVFDTTNMVVLGGSLFVLEKVFGIESSLGVSYLEDIMDGIKKPNETPITEIYPKENVVCLFGVGTSGAGESITDVKDVKYYEREIKDMIPLRQTSSELTAEEASKYWFRKTVEVDGVSKTAYYLKKFESEPEIKVLWRDAEGDEDGSEVPANVYDTPSTVTTGIDTFVEIVLKISKKDIREYFEDSGNVEQTRFNTFGLFTGIRHLVDADTGEYDYRQVKLFSKLNINNEMLTLAKDLTIVYRIFTS